MPEIITFENRADKALSCLIYLIYIIIQFGAKTYMGIGRKTDR